LDILAEIVVAPYTIVTGSTHHARVRHNPIADLKPLDAIPRVHNLSRPLMTGYIRSRTPRRTHTGVRSQVARADATGMDADQYLVIRGDGTPVHFLCS
jgi:hypothetical protein